MLTDKIDDMMISPGLEPCMTGCCSAGGLTCSSLTRGFWCFRVGALMKQVVAEKRACIVTIEKGGKKQINQPLIYSFGNLPGCKLLIIVS